MPASEEIVDVDLERLDEVLAGLDHKFHANTVLVPGEDYYVMAAAARAYRDLLANGERLMEVTEKNAPVLRDGRYLAPGHYIVIPSTEEDS